jgi:hypothetical protein
MVQPSPAHAAVEARGVVTALGFLFMAIEASEKESALRQHMRTASVAGLLAQEASSIGSASSSNSSSSSSSSRPVTTDQLGRRIDRASEMESSLPQPASLLLLVELMWLDANDTTVAGASMRIEKLMPSFEASLQRSDAAAAAAGGEAEVAAPAPLLAADALLQPVLHALGSALLSIDASGGSSSSSSSNAAAVSSSDSERFRKTCYASLVQSVVTLGKILCAYQCLSVCQLPCCRNC